jgi:4-pyridoxate dehydrogenase
MAYTRGNRADYDGWAQRGARGWSHADVLPYFKRGETWQNGENAWRGGTGPLGTQYAKTRDPLFDAWMEAGVAAGFPYNADYNGPHQEGFGRGQYTIRDGRRSSSARAYLRPARHRRNLEIKTQAHATRVLIEGGRASGVELVRGSRDLVSVRATCEVILCAGTFNSPQLLMLSGIGPAAHLREFGIKPSVDLPVGRNLQDHLGAYLSYARRQPGAFHREMRFDRMAVSMIRAYVFGRGPATVVPGGLHAFIKTRPELAVPDIEFMFRGTSPHPHLWFPLIRPAFVDGFGIRPTLLHPYSRGEILLRSADPRDPPRICYNFFSAPDDIKRLRTAFRIARELAHQSALDPYRGAETNPGDQVHTDADIDAWLRRTVITAHHPAGTCAMGTLPGTVLDPELRVHGVAGLRVVDASAMPDLISAHINACVLMMAEKAADIIRGREPLPRELDA